MDWTEFLPLIKMALEEDIGTGDITTKSCISQEKNITAQIISKEIGVLAGIGLAKLVFLTIDEQIRFVEKVTDGCLIESGKIIAIISGNAQSILSAERTALNILQRLSGIATLTNRFVELVKPYRAQIFDTRKTTPLWRKVEKYAVKTGGGTNHRFGLFDGILIKDNHITIAGDNSIKSLITLATDNKFVKGMKIEIETQDIEQVKEAVDLDVDIIMLDNMSKDMMLEAVKIIRDSKKKILIEVSGGVNLNNVQQIAAADVDIISIGALTHSPKALDLSLKVLNKGL